MNINRFLLLFLLLVISCQSTKKLPQEQPIDSTLWTILYKSENSKEEEQRQLIIKNQADLEALFEAVNQTEIPKIDFKKSQVLALFLGSKNTGGYAIMVDKVEETLNEVIVYTSVQTPTERATMAFTNPVLIVEVKSRKTVVIK